MLENNLLEIKYSSWNAYYLGLNNEVSKSCKLTTLQLNVSSMTNVKQRHTNNGVMLPR